MRVLVVADVVGGVRTFTWELARGLSRLGVEVHLALIGPEDPPASVPFASAERADLRLEWMDEPWEDVETTADWIDDLVMRTRPDVLHMNTFTPVRDPTVPVVLSAHSCVASWWRAVHGCDAPARWERYRMLIRGACARADQVVSPSAALLAAMGECHGEIARARVINPGRAIRPAPAGPTERLVVTAGRLWDEAKNVASVAAAAPAIDARVVAIGPGEAGGLEATGALDEAGVFSWMRRAQVFAEPARYEPFGLAALEAALCGCALVLGDIPSLREIWGPAATYVDPDDPEALAAAVNGLIGDSRRRARALRAATARALRYTPLAAAEAYLDTYAAATRVNRAVPA